MRINLETVVVTRQKYANEENQDLSAISRRDLVDQAVTLSNMITKTSASNQFMPVSEINGFFTGLLPIASVISTTEPKRCIPEICAYFISVHNSITAIEPFSTNLS